MALGLLVLILQACGTPDLIIKKEDTHLPTGFKAGVS